MRFRKKWDGLLAEKIRAGVEPTVAARQVNRENPGLRAAMLSEHNAGAGAERAAARFRAEAMAKGVEV